MITQTINIYNKDNEKCDHIFVCLCVKIRFNGKMPYHSKETPSRSHWQRGLRRVSTTACLMKWSTNITVGMHFWLLLVLCVVRYRLCFGLIIRAEESYQVWCVLCVVR
jgi:hypothetical protein